MRVVVAGIPNPGLQVPLGLEVDWAVEAAKHAMDASPTAFEGELEVQQARGRRVEIHLYVRATAPATCDRCGQLTERTVETDIDLCYLPHLDEREAELELGADDMDIGWYRDGALELADVVREALALELPSRTVCIDTEGCNARTEALLDEGGKQGADNSVFAALRQLN